MKEEKVVLMKYIYIVNRFNLKEKTDRIIERLHSVSKQFQRDYEILINDSIEEAKSSIQQFKDSEYIITCIGGDGSINLLLNDLIKTKNILSFIPSGTGNDFNRACKRSLENGIHDVDIIRINDRYFINVACFGIDADIANDDRFIHNKLIPESMRYNAGVIYYFLTYKPRKMKIEINGEVIEKPFTTVVAANDQYYGGGYRVSPNSSISDGVMEVALADALNKVNMAKIILSMKDASHLKNPALRMISTTKAVISADQPFKANIDGEPLLSDRFELELIPKRFRIEYNKEFIEKVTEKL